MSGVPMSVWSARTTAAPRHGARQMLENESTLLFIPATTACWRRARLRSPSHLRTRENTRASAPSSETLPAGKLTVRPAS